MQQFYATSVQVAQRATMYNRTQLCRTHVPVPRIEPPHNAAVCASDALQTLYLEHVETSDQSKLYGYHFYNHVTEASQRSLMVMG
jgi:hypothetical protein